MKKKVLSTLLAMLMVLSVFTVLPITASAAVHNLSIRRNGVRAQSGTDYEWDTTDPNKLIIKTNGLTVTGTTTAEYIEVAAGVNDLTVYDLSISRETDGNAIEFKDCSNPCTLTVKGSNSISGANALCFEGSGIITGTGDLSATGTTGNGIDNPDGDLTLDCSGTVTAKGAVVGICFFGDLTVTKRTGAVVACGNGSGAFQVSGAMTVDSGLVMTGSTTYDAAEADITGEAAFDSGSHCVKTGGAVAKSVLIKGSHKLNVIKPDGSAAVEGTDYEWDATYPKIMNILANGLTVTSTGVPTAEHIETVKGVTDLTVKDLSIDSNSWAIYVLEDSAFFTLTVLGDNTLLSSHGGCGAVIFDGDGKITGTGNLSGSSVLSQGDLILDCSGTITADNGNGSHGVTAIGDLTVTENTGKIVAFNDNDFGAFVTTGALTVAPNLKMTGSTTYRATEAEITGETAFDEANYGVTVDGEAALSVLIVNTLACITNGTTDGNGTIDLPKSAVAGETVTVTVTPNEGYKLKTLTVVDADGETVTVTGNTFTMPEKAVTVTATFGLLHEYDENHRCTDCHDMDPQYLMEKEDALAIVRGVYQLDTGKFDFAFTDELVRKDDEPLYSINEVKFYRVGDVITVIYGGSSHAKMVTFTLVGGDKVNAVTTYDMMTEAVTGTYTAANGKGGANLVWLWILLGILGLLIVLYVVVFFIWKKKEELPGALSFLGFLVPSFKAINNALFKKKDDKE